MRGQEEKLPESKPVTKYVKPKTCEGCGAKPCSGKKFRKWQRRLNDHGRAVPDSVKNTGSLKLVRVPETKEYAWLCRQCRKVGRSAD